MTRSESGEVRRIVEGGGRHRKGALHGSWMRVCQDEGVSGMGQRKVAGIWKRMKSQRGKLGDEGLEVVERMVECVGAVEDSAESCRKGAHEGVQTGTGSKSAEVAGMLQ